MFRRGTGGTPKLLNEGRDVVWEQSEVRRARDERERKGRAGRHRKELFNVWDGSA